MKSKGFECLFNLFKKYYLHHVFSTWNPQTNLYATESGNVRFQLTGLTSVIKGYL